MESGLIFFCLKITEIYDSSINCNASLSEYMVKYKEIIRKLSQQAKRMYKE